jgi:WhiB family redox-sensing transcriptional regulator
MRRIKGPRLPALYGSDRLPLEKSSPRWVLSRAVPLDELTIAPVVETWVRQANCRDSVISFYPPLGGESATARERRELAAKRVCQGCAVRTDCLEYSLRVRETLGVWGGLTPAERRELERFADGANSAV